MSFSVRRSNGTILMELPDSTIDRTETSLSLCGRGSSGYAQAFAENWLHLLENFANFQPPRAPIVGQTWYDTSSGTLKVYDGANWRSLAIGGEGSRDHVGSADHATEAEYAAKAGDAGTATLALTARKWTMPRRLRLTGDLIGEAMIDGSEDITIITELSSSLTVASRANRLSTPRKISLGGKLSGEAMFDGSSDITINANIGPSGVDPGTYNEVTVGLDGRVISATNRPEKGLDYIEIVDRKAAGTPGGTTTPGVWAARALNTVVADPNDLRGSNTAFVVNNIITLTTGKWFIVASAPAAGVGGHRARLYNVTNNTVALWGTVEQASVGVDGEPMQTRSLIVGEVQVTGNTQFRIEHLVAALPASGANQALGLSSTFVFGAAHGGPETYTIFRATKLD
jgi:hypothetical protein